MAYATEVDKRRKSTDSNSPKRNSSSPRFKSSTSAAASGAPDYLDPPPTSFEQERGSILGMKFKGSYRSSRHTPSSSSSISPPPQGSGSNNNNNVQNRVPTPGSSGSRAATPSSQHGGRVPTPGSGSGAPGRSKSPLPGENLPEHHPKKRYFAETRGDGGYSPVNLQQRRSGDPYTFSPPPASSSSSGGQMPPPPMSSPGSASQPASSPGARGPPGNYFNNDQAAASNYSRNRQQNPPMR